MTNKEAINVFRQVKFKFGATGSEHDIIAQAINTLEILVAQTKETLIKEEENKNGKTRKTE